MTSVASAASAASATMVSAGSLSAEEGAAETSAGPWLNELQARALALKEAMCGLRSVLLLSSSTASATTITAAAAAQTEGERRAAAAQQRIVAVQTELRALGDAQTRLRKLLSSARHTGNFARAPAPAMGAAADGAMRRLMPAVTDWAPRTSALRAAAESHALRAAASPFLCCGGSIDDCAAAAAKKRRRTIEGGGGASAKEAAEGEGEKDGDDEEEEEPLSLESQIAAAESSLRRLLPSAPLLTVTANASSSSSSSSQQQQQQRRWIALCAQSVFVATIGVDSMPATETAAKATIVPAFIAVRGADEGAGAGASRHEVWRAVSAQARLAAAHFARVAPRKAVMQTLLWLASFRRIFLEPCAGCGRIVPAIGIQVNTLPPVVRDFTTLRPFHPACFPVF